MLKLGMIMFSIPMPWMASFIPIRRQVLSMRSPHRDSGWSINLENKKVTQTAKASTEMVLTTKSCNHQNLVFYTWLKTSESGKLYMDIVPVPAACLPYEFWHSKSALMCRHYYRCVICLTDNRQIAGPTWLTASTDLNLNTCIKIL